MTHHAKRIKEAIELAITYGPVDGAMHKAWVIDQIVRILAGDLSSIFLFYNKRKLKN
jgi:hypothetical protein